VVPGLFISGTIRPPDDFDSLDVDAIVDLEDWAHDWPTPLPPVNKIFVRYPIHDEDEVDPKSRDVAGFVAALVESGNRVLIHCTQGLNRSGLVAALALMRMGRAPVDAIETVREARGEDEEGFGALGNDAFVGWLLQSQDEGVPDGSR
jgi:Dual specificity phosphatase, catalytic domain